MRLSFRSSLALCAVLLTAPPALAAAPVSLNHAGYVLGAADVPLTGSVAIRFRVYDTGTVGSGDLAWEGVCASVPVSSGYYSVVLGGAQCPGSTAGGLDPTLDTDDLPPSSARWLEVQVGSVTLAPRLLVAAAPVATLAARSLDADSLGGHAATDYALASGLSAVATSGAYGDLTGLPSLSAVATSGQYADLGGAPLLAAVATSGDYSDLSGTPSLAAVATSGDYSDLSGTPSLAAVATSGQYGDLSGTPTLGTAAARDVGSAAGQLVALDGSGRLPPLDGSQLTGISASQQASSDKHGLLALRQLAGSSGATGGLLGGRQWKLSGDEWAAGSSAYTHAGSYYTNRVGTPGVSTGPTGWSYSGPYTTFVDGNTIRMDQFNYCAYRSANELTGNFVAQFNVPAAGWSAINGSDSAVQIAIGTAGSPSTGNQFLGTGSVFTNHWMVTLARTGVAVTLTAWSGTTAIGTFVSDVLPGDELAFWRLGSTLTFRRNGRVAYTFASFSDGSGSYRFGLGAAGYTSGGSSFDFVNVRWIANLNSPSSASSTGSTGWTYSSPYTTFPDANTIRIDQYNYSTYRTNPELAGDFTARVTVPTGGWSATNNSGTAVQLAIGTAGSPSTGNQYLGSGSVFTNHWMVTMARSGTGITLSAYSGTTALGTFVSDIQPGDVLAFYRLGATLTFRRNGNVLYTFAGFSDRYGLYKFGLGAAGNTTGGTYFNFSNVQWSSNVNATGNMVLTTPPVALGAAPSAATAYFVYVDETGTSTPGTDLTAEFSRDGGTTWTAAALTNLLGTGGFDGGQSAFKATAALGGQPPGTSLVARLKTFNGKLQRIGPTAISAE